MPQQTPPRPMPKKKRIRVPRVVNGVEQMVEIEVDDVAGPGWGPNDKHALLNHRLTRVDGPLKVTGAANYTYDVRLPKMLYGRILRCPHGHARLKNCDAVVEAEYFTPRIHHACLETHGMVVDFSGGNSATIYATTQGTFTIPADAAGALGLPESAVTATVQHMGGGFGSKFGIGIEGGLACRLSKET